MVWTNSINYTWIFLPKFKTWLAGAKNICSCYLALSVLWKLKKIDWSCRAPWYFVIFSLFPTLVYFLMIILNTLKPNYWHMYTSPNISLNDWLYCRLHPFNLGNLFYVSVWFLLTFPHYFKNSYWGKKLGIHEAQNKNKIWHRIGYIYVCIQPNLRLENISAFIKQ